MLSEFTIRCLINSTKTRISNVDVLIQPVESISYEIWFAYGHVLELIRRSLHISCTYIAATIQVINYECYSERKE